MSSQQITRGGEYTDESLEQLELKSTEASQDHLYYALDYVVKMLDDAGIKYAVMGGVSMQLRGFYERTTQDIDLAVDVKMRDLLSMLAQHGRIWRPRPIAASTGVARCFVLTGPEYEENLPTSIPVEVDFILSGNLGAPKDITRGSIRMDVVTPLGVRGYNILNLMSIFTAKLRSYSTRWAEKDYSDLEWMVFNHSQEVEGFADDLNWDERHAFINGVAESGNYSEEGLNFIRRTLHLAER
ncbi:hypothetical protein F4810DRAFT_680711 [Camillea tinctor]|nr:hypothetical protein F4810DRAFT_680711 [Camillea tinctor]